MYLRYLQHVTCFYFPLSPLKKFVWLSKAFRCCSRRSHSSMERVMRKDTLIFIACEKNFQRFDHLEFLVGHAVRINLSYGQKHIRKTILSRHCQRKGKCSMRHGVKFASNKKNLVSRQFKTMEHCCASNVKNKNPLL